MKKKVSLLLAFMLTLFIAVGCSNDDAEPVIETNPIIEEIVEIYAEATSGLANDLPEYSKITLSAGHGYEIVLTFVFADEYIDDLADGDLDAITEILEGDTFDQTDIAESLAMVLMRDFDLDALRITILYVTEDETELLRDIFDF